MMEWWQILLIVLGSLLLLFVLSIVFYKQFFKRFWDIVLSGLALIVLLPILLILMVVGAIAMGGNPFFTQKRLGKKDRNGNERIFKLIKFRTMSNKKDDSGNLLPDEQRLNKYGKFLRSTSLDELPELLNILIGNMSIIGPRPLLVQYLERYSEEQRHRHDVRPGLTGYAQCHGRNALTWKEKFEMDVWYTRHISLFGDVKIIFETVFSVFKREGISSETSATMEEFMGNDE
jgi:undecaprenyl phosphate N,N'-diacetylbacillosamine 1-phosphate transferase